MQPRIKILICSTLLFARMAVPQQVAARKPPVVVEFVVPGYPQLQNGGREAGEVQVEISISPTGTVTAAKAVSGPRGLRQSAVFAARRWSFRPEGRENKSWILTFEYILARGFGDPPGISAAFKLPNRMQVFSDIKQSRAVRRLSPEEIEQQVTKLIQEVMNEKTEQDAFDDLESMGCAAVPAIIRRMDDRRNLPEPRISLVNKAPDAFEARRFYGPEKVVDALAAILNQITGHDFGFIYNGGTESERRSTVNRWRAFLATTPSSKLCE
jgi:TonB family protein